MDAPNDKKTGIGPDATHPPASLTLQGGEAIENVSLGAVLPQKEAKQEQASPPEKDHKILKAVGIALAVAVPAALLGKHIYAQAHGIGASQAR